MQYIKFPRTSWSIYHKTFNYDGKFGGCALYDGQIQLITGDAKQKKENILIFTSSTQRLRKKAKKETLWIPNCDNVEGTDIPSRLL